jgi:hypothetical protein
MPAMDIFYAIISPIPALILHFASWITMGSNVTEGWGKICSEERHNL